MEKIEIINVARWVESNKHCFVPPVCNKLMHKSQLDIMFVGGPNERTDFHLEEGEELFLQLVGDMHVLSFVDGRQVCVNIRQGEIFLLPANTFHSPQRPVEGSVGLVIERERVRGREFDALTYFCANQSQAAAATSTQEQKQKLDERFSERVLFQRFFYCEDLGTQLVPVIQEYKASSECATGEPTKPADANPPVHALRSPKFEQPFSFRQWLDAYRNELDARAAGRDGLEQAVAVFDPKRYQSHVYVFGQGAASGLQEPNADTWIWLLEGSATLKVAGRTLELARDDSVLLPPATTYSIERSEASYVFYYSQDPARK